MLLEIWSSESILDLKLYLNSFLRFKKIRLELDTRPQKICTILKNLLFKSGTSLETLQSI